VILNGLNGISKNYIENQNAVNDIFLFIFRENRWSNEEWTIQRHRQHQVHKTQDEDKQNKKIVAITSHFLKFQAQAAIKTLISSPTCPIKIFTTQKP
jgi:hypothetical protein